MDNPKNLAEEGLSNLSPATDDNISQATGGRPASSFGKAFEKLGRGARAHPGMTQDELRRAHDLAAGLHSSSNGLKKAAGIGGLGAAGTGTTYIARQINSESDSGSSEQSDKLDEPNS